MSVMKRIAALCALLALQACAGGAAPAAKPPERTADGRLILSSVPASVIPDPTADMPKADAYCATQGKVARITSISTNVPRGSIRRNEIYFECVAASDADKPKPPA